MMTGTIEMIRMILNVTEKTDVIMIMTMTTMEKEKNLIKFVTNIATNTRLEHNLTSLLLNYPLKNVSSNYSLISILPYTLLPF